MPVFFVLSTCKLQLATCNRPSSRPAVLFFRLRLVLCAPVATGGLRPERNKACAKKRVTGLNRAGNNEKVLQLLWLNAWLAEKNNTTVLTARRSFS